MADAVRVAVVGGGITGLATAWYLRTGAAPARAEVTLVEEDHRLGGKLRTEELAGVPVEAGPDTFLARAPWAVDLCRELGLGDELEAPATDRAHLWTGGRLRPLPRGTVLGVPVTARSLFGSGILSGRGAARAALDLVLPARGRARTSRGAQVRTTDRSVAELVSARLGREVLDRLVDPLVGGINAGQADHLSARATARPLANAAERHRSLILGLRQERATTTGGGPLFLGVAGGLERLVDGLRASLKDDVEIRGGTRVTALSAADGRYRLACADGPDAVADAVVLAVPAFAAASILRRAVPAAATGLDAIGYASVAVVTLGYRPAAIRADLDGSGFLVPRTEGRLMTACTWSTNKWPALRDSGLVLLRASAGRAGDDRAMELDDDELVARIHGELADAVGPSEPPAARLLTRWPRSFPQYEPGHADLVDRIEAAVADLPGVVLAGAAYRGLGIAACIQQAEHAAGRVMAVLAHRPAPPRRLAGRSGDT